MHFHKTFAYFNSQNLRNNPIQDDHTKVFNKILTSFSGNYPESILPSEAGFFELLPGAALTKGNRDGNAGADAGADAKKSKIPDPNLENNKRKAPRTKFPETWLWTDATVHGYITWTK